MSFRYLSLYGALWRNSVIRDMHFKVNFILWIVVEALWFFLQVAFMTVLYGQTENIGGWTRWEVIMLIGVANFTQQVFTAMFLTNFTELSEHVRTGRLDFILLLPVNARFLISLSKVDLSAYVNGAMAAVVIAYAGYRLDLHPSLVAFAAFGVALLAALTIHYSLMFILAAIAFWTVRAQSAVWGYYNLFNIARLPDGAFPEGAFRTVFTWVLPMILVANVPAKALVGRLTSWTELSRLCALAAISFWISEWFWRTGLRRYSSASS